VEREVEGEVEGECRHYVYTVTNWRFYI